MLPSFTHVRPNRLTNALDLMTREGARIHAGGTDLIGCLRDGVFTADHLVSLANVAALRGIRQAGGGVTIGAMTPLAVVASDAAIRSGHTALAEAAASVGSPQIRAQGTLGGNLCQKTRCWYYRGDFHCLRKGGERCFAYEGDNSGHAIFGGELCFMVHPSDTATALAALGAKFRIAGTSGERAVAAEAFFVPPSVDPRRHTVLETGEILTDIALPAPTEGTRSASVKARNRRAWDFAKAGASVKVDFDGDTVRSARVFLSGVAAVPWRAEAAEVVLAGAVLDEATVAEAADAATTEAEPLEHNGYKVALVRGVVAEALDRIRG